MESFIHVVGMLGGIAMAILVPLLLANQCGFDNPDGLAFVTIISIVSIGCGFALCRHCLLAASGHFRHPDSDESKKNQGTP